MSAEKCEGLILRLTDFSETSRIVVVLTREFGKISALAKKSDASQRNKTGPGIRLVSG